MSETITTPSPLTSVRTIEKFDGSQWRYYQSESSLIVLTSAGRNLLANGSGFHSDFARYNEEYLAGITNGQTRNYLTEGDNAWVYTLGNQDLVVKEAKPDKDQLLGSLERMDRLTGAIETHCPRWIDMPKHYGVIVPKSDPSRQFMLIQKIDEGLTVGDIVKFKADIRGPRIAEVLSRFGKITPELREEVIHRVEMLREEVRHALLAEHLSPDEYIPDIDHNLENIVIERLDTPIAGSNYRYWIIDQ